MLGLGERTGIHEAEASRADFAVNAVSIVDDDVLEEGSEYGCLSLEGAAVRTFILDNVGKLW